MEQYENYWIDLATAKGNLLRRWFNSSFGAFIGTGNEEYMYRIYKELPQARIRELFENNSGNLELQNIDVSLVVRHNAYSDYSGDFVSIEHVNDEFCSRYYNWLRDDESLNLLMTNNTELDIPDFI